MRPGENIIDTTVDAALANMRNDARQKQLDELINKNIELQQQQLKLQQQQYTINASVQLPEGAEPVTVVEVEGRVEGDAIAAVPAIEVVPSVPLEEEKKVEPDPFINRDILYNSFERSTSYYALRWLWCGCFEPRYKITTSYVIGEEWHGTCCGDGAECCGPNTRCGCLGKNRGCICCCCGTGEHCCIRVTDSMAFENVDDVQRRQTCCYATIGFFCKCFEDMGDIHLMGRDESNKNGWVLKRIHRSKRAFNDLTRIIQNTNGKLGPDGKKQDKPDKQEKKQ